METFMPLPACRSTRVQISTQRPTEFIDLTDLMARVVVESGVRTGILNIQSLHTTTAIVINEHEPLLLTDFEALLERTAPQFAAYRHDDNHARTVNLTAAERPNGHAHCRALFLPSSLCLNISDGHLTLGTWQRIFLLELDGPREREISLVLVGEGRS